MKRLALRVAVGLSLAISCRTSIAHAQEPTVAPKPKFAYVRFWNMVLQPPGAPIGTGELQLGVSDTQSVASATPGNFYASYAPVPPATYNFTVRRAGSINNPIKRLPVVLRADTYITILASTKDNQVTAELIDDTVDPKTIADLPGRLTVRQFMDGAQVKVTVASKDSTEDLAYGQTAVLNDLPVRVVPLSMRAVIQGATRMWTDEMDFTAARHATLLIVADPYGRFRPRLAVDGQVPAAGSARDAGQPSSNTRPVPPPSPRL